MKLTKRYRLLWTNELKIDNRYNEEHAIISVTHINDNANYFESDLLEDIEAKIIELGLTN